MRAVFFPASPDDVPDERIFLTSGEAVAWAETVAERRGQDCFVLILIFGDLTEVHVIGMKSSSGPVTGWKNTPVIVSW